MSTLKPFFASRRRPLGLRGAAAPRSERPDAAGLGRHAGELQQPGGPWGPWLDIWGFP